jgi:hypothetical protein
MGEVLDTSSSVSRVVRAIQLVEQLRAEGLAKAEESQPLRSLTKWQRDFLRQRLDFVAQQHVEAVMSVREAEVCHRFKRLEAHASPACVSHLSRASEDCLRCAASGHQPELHRSGRLHAVSAPGSARFCGVRLRVP